MAFQHSPVCCLYSKTTRLSYRSKHLFSLYQIQPITYTKGKLVSTTCHYFKVFTKTAFYFSDRNLLPKIGSMLRKSAVVFQFF